MSEETIVNEGQQNFDTCKYRSENQEEVGEITCCSNTLHLAYVCFRRQIEDLEPSSCIECDKFVKK